MGVPVFPDIVWKVSKYEVFLVRIFLYSVQIQENTDQKKLRIWIIFTQCEITEIEYRNLSLLTEENILLIALQERTHRIQKETINNIKKKIKWERCEYN